MPKGTILDRLAGAMKTLSKREGKTLTPRQRVAAAQRWNSLADIGERYVDNFPSDVTWRLSDDEAERWHDAIMDAKQIGILEGPSMYDYNRADNPFLSDNIDKYAEQSDFLDWCRYNRLEPNGRNLKQFRWETYKRLPYREQQWIANKNKLDGIESVEDLIYWTDVNKSGRDYSLDGLPTYKSIEEFPNDFDYMWRY